MKDTIITYLPIKQMNENPETIPVAVIGANLMLLLHEIKHYNHLELIDFETSIAMAAFRLREQDKDIKVRDRIIQDLSMALDHTPQEVLT